MDPQDLEVGKMYPLSGRMKEGALKWFGTEINTVIYLGSFVDKTYKTLQGDHPTLYEFLVGDQVKNFSDYLVMQYIGVVKEEDIDPK